MCTVMKTCLYVYSTVALKMCVDIVLTHLKVSMEVTDFLSFLLLISDFTKAYRVVVSAENKLVFKAFESEKY